MKKPRLSNDEYRQLMDDYAKEASSGLGSTLRTDAPLECVASLAIHRFIHGRSSHATMEWYQLITWMEANYHPNGLRRR